MSNNSLPEIGRLGEIFAMLEQAASEISTIAETTTLKTGFNIEDAGFILADSMEKISRLRDESPIVAREFNAGYARGKGTPAATPALGSGMKI